MDLPINNEELGTIVKALTLGGDTALYQKLKFCLLYTSPSPRDRTRSRMPSSA